MRENEIHLCINGGSYTGFYYIPGKKTSTILLYPTGYNKKEEQWRVIFEGEKWPILIHDDDFSCYLFQGRIPAEEEGRKG